LDTREPDVTNWPMTTMRLLISHRWLCSLGGRHVHTPVGITGILV